jgi:sulfate permease, SulP family
MTFPTLRRSTWLRHISAPHWLIEYRLAWLRGDAVAGITVAAYAIPVSLAYAGLAGLPPQTHYLVLAVGVIAMVLLVLGDRWLPGKPVALGVVALSIVAASVLGLRAFGVPTTGTIPAGLPELQGPSLRLTDVEGIVPLAAGCLLLAYIEGVSAARAFAAKHGYALDPRQELLGIGAANLLTALGQGYPVAGGLSQSAVNDRAGARTPLALVFASITLALCLLFLTGLLENLPKAVLAAVVLTAVSGLLDFPALFHMWRVSRLDFYAAAIALGGVLLLGILQGILLAALASILMLLVRASSPHVAFLGRIPGTNSYSDIARHPENEVLPGVIAARPEASLIYVNSDAVLAAILNRVRAASSSDVRMVVCDLSASPYLDLAGSHMLHELHGELADRGIALRIVGALGRVRDLLRADGLDEKVGGLDRADSLGASLSGDGS